MKKIVLAAILILAVMTGRTQSFEGTIRWNLKMDVTDPDAKAKMEEAKKKAADPANQAKIKELESKMKDPQFKAMLDANPQMKVQMEAMLKMMQGGDMTAMLPSSVLVKIKGNNSLVNMKGGMMDGMEVLNLGDMNETYRIDHSAKTFTLIPKAEISKQPTTTVTKTSETQKILNYNCTKYIVDITTPEGKTVKSNYWATTELNVDMKAFAKQQMGNQQFVFPDIDGFPIKVESEVPQMGTITIETAEVKKGGVSASDVQLPTGYKEAKM